MDSMVNLKKRRGFETAFPEELLDLHYSTPVVDAHCDTLSRCAPRDIDFGRRLPAGHIDLKKLKKGGIKLQVFAAFIHPSQWYRGFITPVNRMFEKLDETVSKYPEQLSLIYNRSTLDESLDSNRVSAVKAIEGLHLIKGKLENLRTFHERGVRVTTLTWNNSNEFAVSAMDDAMHGVSGGLTAAGRDIIKEMNRLGVIIDLSHSSSATLKDVLRISKQPVLVSHSCCRELNDIFRNLTDEEIVLVAEKKGVIGVNYHPLFLDDNYRKIYFKLWNRRLNEYKRINTKYSYRSNEAKRLKRQIWTEMRQDLPNVSHTRIIDHMEHIISIAGENSVGLGSDFDGIPDTPIGMENVSKLPLLTHEMLRRGWNEKRIKKVLGRNMLRLFNSILK
jgi:membrane dipeptidase